jgi:D-serine dehydratase
MEMGAALSSFPADLALDLRARRPLLWLNPRRQSVSDGLPDDSIDVSDVTGAAKRLQRFAPLLVQLFPETKATAGIIESELKAVDAFRQYRACGRLGFGRWFVKCDHALPIAGSIKARGGLYEVLVHAEKLALGSGVLESGDDPTKLLSFEARDLFARRQIAVGSTGNLGLSIGILANRLGFQVTVHMSANAKGWKKDRLRRQGVTVIEHSGDFRAAVAAGRQQAASSPKAYFVDDENSRELFLGYSVAALRLKPQLEAAGVAVDTEHPLFVYLPCGVGGAPGGVTFGLRYVFGDHVHCFFAEPTECPKMLVRLALREDRPISVREMGFDNQTEADGLAVPQASEFAAPLMRTRVSGIFTVPDKQLFEDLYHLERTENMQIEPSAAAALRGPEWVLDSDQGDEYLQRNALKHGRDQITHILWSTGGSLMPREEYRYCHDRGRNSK